VRAISAIAEGKKMRAWLRGMSAMAALCLVAAVAAAQQPVSRLKGRVTTASGQPIAGAEVRAEAIFGSGAGTFAGQRTFSERTNAKGEWSIMGIAPGIWIFDIVAPGDLPESVALPIRLLTASGPNAGGQLLTWQLVLKPVPPPPGEAGVTLSEALDAARGGHVDQVRALFARVPDDADADFLAGAGRIAMLARESALARALFLRALDRDPSSYRAALGVASTLLLQRDFDNASRAFDATRNRTHDKDEQKFLTFAIGDLATIRTR
jgi:hypothetical protein